MANAKRDNNYIPVLLGTLNTNGTTVVPVYAGVSFGNHNLMVSDGTSGVDHHTENAQRDENRVPALWATSSLDGVTPVAVYTDSSHNLLIQST